jgi:hypothetical protein
MVLLRASSQKLMHYSKHKLSLVFKFAYPVVIAVSTTQSNLVLLCYVCMYSLLLHPSIVSIFIKLSPIPNVFCYYSSSPYIKILEFLRLVDLRERHENSETRFMLMLCTPSNAT